MIPFLRQVAEHYYGAAGDIQKYCFIFPNRRAQVFFQRYLAEKVKGSQRPLIAPLSMTIDDFFYRVAGERKTDRVLLLLKLYDCYRELNSRAESLDDFIFWGDVILNDFGDVDKYLIDAEKIFTNVSDFRSLQDTLSYLTDTQREAIEKFLSHFSTGGAMKENFLQVWDILGPLYVRYRQVLRESGLSYDGMVYRKLAESMDEAAASDVLSTAFPYCEKFIFSGLNALNECEKKVLRKMRNAHIAEFCWDFSSAQIKDSHNKSSLFLRENLLEFPQAFTLDPEGLPEQEYNVISVSSSVGQAKMLPSILGNIPEEERGIRTAVVLPDENLLIPVLNSLPEDIEDINVTMGYPMKGSELYSLMSEVAALQMHLRCKEGTWYFYHRQVWAIFSNTLFKAVAGEEGMAKIAGIKAAARYYIPQNDLQGLPLFDCIFRAAAEDITKPSAQTVRNIQKYLLDITVCVAGLVKEMKGGNALELDFAKRYYEAVRSLGEYELDLLPATYFKLISQIVGGETVPFKGEPLRGLQIMGPLETRAVDFDNVIILSCNEGVFPRHPSASSFIPAELRTGFGLPTYEYRDAMNAYYFYRLVQRARKVWMLYDSRTDGLQSGEESRYIRQLDLHFAQNVRRFVAKAPINEPEPGDSIPKTPEDVETIHSLELSATAMQSYLACPAQFYYSKVKGLSAEDEVAESLDAGMIGNVFHSTMQKIYSVEGGIVTQDFIDDWMSRRKDILSIISSKILEELNTIEISGRNLIFRNVILQYVLKTLERDRDLMDAYGVDSFRILGLEQKKKLVIDGFVFKGFIDRIDSFTPGEVRVVDYKTGKVKDTEIDINDSTAARVVSELFADESQDRPKIALQLYLYDMFIKADKAFSGDRIVNSIYPAAQLFVSDVKNVALSEVFCGRMKDALSSKLSEMVDLNTPFRRTKNERICENCDFKMICGR